MTGERIGLARCDDDPFVLLALAVLQRAIDDARGRRTRLCGKKKERAIAEARRWLLDGAEGLLCIFDVDHDALIAAMGLKDLAS